MKREDPYPGGRQWIEENFSQEFSYPHPDEVSYNILNSHDDLDVIEESYDGTTISVDTETTGFHYEEDDILGICFCFNEQFSFYLPIAHVNGNNNAPDGVVDRFIDLLHDSNEVIFYNARFDMSFLEQVGFKYDETTIKDLQVLIYNIDKQFKKYSLDQVIENIFDWPSVPDPDYSRLALYTPSMLLEYAAMDAFATYMGYEWFRQYEDMKINQLDHALMFVLYEMERVPTKVDAQYMEQMHDHYTNKRDALAQEIKHALDRPNINLDSDQQLANALQEMGIDTNEYTEKEGRMSVSKEALENVNHDIADKLNQYRTISTSTLSKGVEAFLRAYDPDLRGCRFGYRNCSTATSRLSAGGENGGYFGGINIQNIEKRGKAKYKLVEGGDDFLGFNIQEAEEEYDFKSQQMEGNIRHGMKPPEGYAWVSLDYSGQEVRLAANYSGDQRMMKPLQEEGADFHRQTLNEVLKPLEPDDKNFIRNDAKPVTYGVFYGAGPSTIADSLGVKVELGEQILDQFWNQYARFEDWANTQIKKAKRRGYITNRFDVKRWIRKYLGDNEYYVEHIAVNHPIQSTGGVMIKKALIDIWYHVVEEYGYDVIKPLATLHDEVNYAVSTEDMELFCEVLLKIEDLMHMKFDGWPIDFPVDIDIGPSFGQLIPCEKEDGRLKLAGKYDLIELNS